MKVFMAPRAEQAPTDNGIGRIIHAMERHLPEYGVEFTNDPDRADVTAYHAGTANGKRVDVLHCHGLYWSDLQHHEFSRANNTANQRIIEAARRAKIITVPSEWVAEPFKRDMRISPAVVGHGIDLAEWDAGQAHQGYILWNKNRPTDVCDPSPAWRLAEKGMKVVSTFGPTGKLIPNLRVTGQLPFERMKPIIQQAEIYLATAPETFGIGTLEAMACGVPVLGYDWCGTKDLIQHKVNGWLAPVGDIEGLAEGARWLKDHRDEAGAAAREFAMAFDWPRIMAQYYRLYCKAAQPDPTGVSIVITNYNYGRWVADAIKSCEWQQVRPDEIIVVDDGSLDNSLQVLKPYAEQGRVRLITQDNQGVAAARNNGITASRFPFLVCLDADDMLAPEFIAALRPRMEQDRGLGIAYSGVKYINAEGVDTGFGSSKSFMWEIQTRAEVPPPTCIPSGSMFRKSMWERCGGYKQKYAPGEDTEFWTHGLSLGFTAELITPEMHFWYRGHDGSASRTKKYVAIDDNKPWIKDKVYPMGAPAYYVPAVRSYLNPVISVIIPVGPGHEKLVEDAIESVIGQNIREWELLLMDDTASIPESFLFPLQRKYPFLKTIRTLGKEGAGAARNYGINQAKGKFVFFLDADDWIRADCFDLMLQAHAKTGHYVFCDHVEVHADGRQFNRSIMPYDREVYQRDQVMHAVTALVPAAWAKDVGGFDPALIGWEEYDFYMKLAVKGYCGVLIHQNLLYYRVDSGERRKISHRNENKLNAEFAKRYKGVEMAGCCGNAGNAILEAKRVLNLIPRETINIAELPNEVRMEYTGPFMAPVAFSINGRTYYGAKDELNKYINAPREDVEKLLQTGRWAIVAPPPEARVLLQDSDPDIQSVLQAGLPNPAPFIRRG
jgi:glycosyltransferase involved in cell wall biosynthesis